MSRANPLWGAPRIHGELLKLGFEVAQSTVARYVCRRSSPPDVVLHNTDGTVSLWQMNGAQVNASTVGSVGAEWHIQSTADFNADGQGDVLWRTDGGNVSIWLMNGGQIQSDPLLGSTGNEWHVTGTGDFNGDGRSDILWHSDSGLVSMWFMNGTPASILREVLAS